jgi:CheY-like chemotaxis protein
MAFAFNGDSFGHVLDDVQHVVAGAREVERRLVALVDTLDVDWTPNNARASVLEAVRDVCVDARTHRERVEALVARLAEDVTPGDGSPKRRRVLVVDDSPDNRELVTTVLEHAGFETLTARDGLEAVIVAHYARPAVIVMDVTMPVLNGIEAARLLKASAVTRRVKVIAYTARPEFYEPPFADLFEDVVKKPAPPTAILASVERFIDREMPDQGTPRDK